MAVRFDLKVDQGSTYNRVFTYKNSNGSLIDLTGFTSRMQIRESYQATSVILELNTANAGIVLGGTLGTITLNITPAQTLAINMNSLVGIPPYQNYVYDLELINGTNIKKLINGFFTLIEAVSR